MWAVESAVLKPFDATGWRGRETQASQKTSMGSSYCRESLSVARFPQRSAALIHTSGVVVDASRQCAKKRMVVVLLASIYRERV